MSIFISDALLTNTVVALVVAMMIMMTVDMAMVTDSPYGICGIFGKYCHTIVTLNITHTS